MGSEASLLGIEIQLCRLLAFDLIHLYNYSTYTLGHCENLNELIYLKCLEQLLAHDHCHTNVSCLCSYTIIFIRIVLGLW